MKESDGIDGLEIYDEIVGVGFEDCSDDVSIDDWRPRVKKAKIIPSEWRQEQIVSNFNQQPGTDELRKIYGFLKKNVPDYDIMNAFGISAEMLVAIKSGHYDPVDGISLDSQSKIYKEFRKIEDRIEALERGFQFLADCMFSHKDDFKALKKAMKKPKKKSYDKRSKYEEMCKQRDEFHCEEE